MLKRFIFTIVSGLISLTGLYGQALSSEILEKLKTSEELQNIFLNDEKVELKLIPSVEFTSSVVENWDSDVLPRLTSEKLFFLDKKSLCRNGDISFINIHKVSKVVRSISSMKGTEYYSNRHKKWETLYHDAYLIKSPGEKIRIPDDTGGSADGKTLYCVQDDNSFGECYYSLKYRETEKEISVCFDNFEPLKFGFITAAKAHNVKINLLVVDEGEHFFVYLMVQAYYPRISMLEEKMIDSFNARVDSIYKWFVGQMGK